MTNSFAARQSKGSSAIRTIAAAGNPKVLSAPRNIMIDYRMRPARILVPWSMRLRLECLFLHVLALQRAAGSRPVGQPALLDVEAAPRQMARRPGRAPG